MKVKEHPQIKYPAGGSWTQPTGRSAMGSPPPTGDIGECILKKATYIPNPAHMKIQVDCQGKEVIGSYDIADEDFAEKLGKKLDANCIGKTIREIGEMEIDF